MDPLLLDYEQDKTLWLIGEEGAYCKLKPRITSSNWPNILNSIKDLEKDGSHMEYQGFLPEDLRLCKDLPTYPYFEGWATVLEDGAAAWGLEEGMQYIVAGQEIPLITAVFW